jgi:hypothetical protein
MIFLLFLEKSKFSSFVTFDGVQLLTGLINSHKVWGSNSQWCAQQCGKPRPSALLCVRCLRIRKSDIRGKNCRFLSIFEHLYFLIEERSQGTGYRIASRPQGLPITKRVPLGLLCCTQETLTKLSKNPIFLYMEYTETRFILINATIPGSTMGQDSDPERIPLALVHNLYHSGISQSSRYWEYFRRISIVRSKRLVSCLIRKHKDTWIRFERRLFWKPQGKPSQAFPNERSLRNIPASCQALSFRYTRVGRRVAIFENLTYESKFLEFDYLKKPSKTVRDGRFLSNLVPYLPRVVESMLSIWSSDLFPLTGVNSRK